MGIMTSLIGRERSITKAQRTTGMCLNTKPIFRRIRSKLASMITSRLMSRLLPNRFDDTLIYGLDKVQTFTISLFSKFDRDCQFTVYVTGMEKTALDTFYAKWAGPVMIMTFRGFRRRGLNGAR